MVRYSLRFAGGQDTGGTVPQALSDTFGRDANRDVRVVILEEEQTSLFADPLKTKHPFPCAPVRKLDPSADTQLRADGGRNR